MPDKPSWFDKIPSALEELHAITEEFIDRSTVERLLEVKRRRAQQLIDTVGAKKLGAAAVVLRQDLITYLEIQAGAEYQVIERARRKKFAQTLLQLQEEHVSKPPLLVDMPFEKQLPLKKKGLAALPPGIELSPGKLTITFETFEEMLEKLMSLAIAGGRDMEELRERVSLKKSKSA